MTLEELVEFENRHHVLIGAMDGELVIRGPGADLPEVVQWVARHRGRLLGFTNVGNRVSRPAATPTLLGLISFASLN